MPSWTTSQVIIACIATFSADMVAGAITLLHLAGGEVHKLLKRTK